LIVKTNDLTKTYAVKPVVDRASLSLHRGEILGFVGPNGAGKSTFMKMLLGVVHPTGGSGLIFGQDIVRDSVAIRRRVGYLPGDMGYYRNLRGRAFLDFCLSFHPRPDRARASRLADRFDLPLGQRIKGYSTGMRQKLGLVQAFSVNAELLILDEPTRGLDPTAQLLFQEILDEELAAGRSVLLSSHLLEEIERICHRIVFIDQGRVLDTAAIERVRDGLRRILRVTLTSTGAAAALQGLPNVAAVRAERTHFELSLNGPAGPTLEALARLDVDSIEYNRPSLQDIYRSIYMHRDAS
jgi:ABC-2 type transport system ATP-binding protein